MEEAVRGSYNLRHDSFDFQIGLNLSCIITIDNKKIEKYENRQYETNSRKRKVVSPLTDGYLKKLHTKKFGVTKLIALSGAEVG